MLKRLETDNPKGILYNRIRKERAVLPPISIFIDSHTPSKNPRFEGFQMVYRGKQPKDVEGFFNTLLEQYPTIITVHIATDDFCRAYIEQVEIPEEQITYSFNANNQLDEKVSK